MRPDGRKAGEIRPVTITQGFVPQAEESVLIEIGNTRVLCAATLEEGVPSYLKGSGSGWVTAEYSMLPRSGAQRTKRERSGTIKGRTQEIQRLIGRSMRSVVDLSALGERTVILDCDVIAADGGTRTASVTGAFLSLGLCLRRLKNQRNIDRPLLHDYLAATSVGIVNEKLLLDLCYEEDFAATVDMNVVAVGQGDLVEIQATGEESTFSVAESQELLNLALSGIEQLIQKQKSVLPSLP